MSATSAEALRPPRPTTGHRPLSTRRARYLSATARPVPVQAAPRATTATPPSLRGRNQVVLDIQNLKTYFFTYDGIVRALDGVDLQLRRGETTGLVGETGCGKSVTAFSVNRLVGEPGRIVSGKVLFRGGNLLWGLEREARFRRQRGGRVKVVRSFRRILAANERMSAIRGRGIAMIFQEPSQAMNPVFSISDQLGESLLLHRGVEIVDGLLAADRGPAAVESTANEIPGAHASVEMDSDSTIDHLLEQATHASSEELRVATDEFAREAGVSSLSPELFYLLRAAGPRALSLRRGVHRTVRRLHLSGSQRSYLKFQRRLMLLQNRLRDVFLKEMQQGKSLSFQRRKVRARIRWEKLKRFYFGVAGVKRRVDRPLKQETFWRTVELLEGVRIANPAQVAKSYPHELSGGMLQRVMIAMALSCEPEVLLADEPTTALDVTIQAQILELMHQLRDRVGTAIALITHDLGVVAEVCDRVNVMYAGVIVESAPVTELFRRPLHPYTQGLLAAVPRMDRPEQELSSIPGSVPNLISPPPGCRFHPRCPYAMPVCKERRPDLLPQGEDHGVACFLYEQVGEASTPVTAPISTGSGAAVSAA
jgi:peptide/nickel transport system ATP-binding protein